MLKACISRYGAFFWDPETGKREYVYTHKRNRETEWRELYKKNKTQKSTKEQEEALSKAKASFTAYKQRIIRRADWLYGDPIDEDWDSFPYDFDPAW